MRSVRVAISLLALAAAAGLARAEVEPGFTSLFNGRNLEGWKVVGDPAGFKVEDGLMVSEGGKNGNLICRNETYGNFVLRLDWMLSTTGNSGIVVRYGGSNPWLEIQLLAPWTPHRDDIHCTGSLYGYIAPSPRPDETTNRWRTAEVACRYKEITVSIDDQLVTRADLSQIADLKNASLRGLVGLQDSHTGPGEWVKFRNLRLRDLDRDPDFVAAGLKSDDVAIRGYAQEAAVALGAPTVGPLCALLAEASPIAVNSAEKTLFAVVAQATAPGNEAYRKAVAEALTGQTKTAPSDRGRAHAARLLGLCGEGPEVAAGLALALRDPATYESARDALRRLPGAAATAALLQAARDLPVAQQPAVLLALGARRDPAALPALTAAAKGPDSPLRVAALEALGETGDAKAAPVLLDAAGKGAVESRQAAVDGLLALADALRATEAKLAVRLYHRALESAVTGPQKAAALVGLAQAEAPGAMGLLFAGLTDEATSRAAYTVLARIPAEKLAAALTEELGRARGAELAALLRLAQDRGVPALESKLLAAARRPDEAPQVAALGILAAQPKADYAPVFAEALANGSAPVKAAAAQGALALADLAVKDGKKDQATELYRKLVAAQPASPAAMTAAMRLRELGDSTDFAPQFGFVTHWWIIGPFPLPDPAQFGPAFFPEQEIALDREYDLNGAKLRWAPHHETKSAQGISELLDLYPNAANVACYAYAEVTSDVERDVLVKLGTDDGFALWLNGRRIGGNPAPRAITVDADTLPAHLVAGPNKILLKVLQGGSRWAFCLRLTDKDGRPLVLPEKQ